MITEDKTIADPEEKGGRVFRTDAGTLVRVRLEDRGVNEGMAVFAARSSVVGEDGVEVMAAPDHMISVALDQVANFDPDEAVMAGSNGAVAAAERAFQRKAALDAVATSWS